MLRFTFLSVVALAVSSAVGQNTSTSTTQPIPSAPANLTCLPGQQDITSIRTFALTNVTITQAANFLLSYCTASIGNTITKCTGDRLNSTRTYFDPGARMNLTYTLLDERRNATDLFQSFYSLDTVSYNASGLAAVVYSNVQGIYVHANKTDRNADYLTFGIRGCVDNATAGRAIFSRYTSLVGPLYVSTLQSISRQLVQNETRSGGRKALLW